MAITYKQIRSQLQTGDLFSFEGHAPLDFMINLMEGGNYSHVGIVLRDNGNKLWFWDAPGVGKQFPDPYKGGQAHKGCRVADLDTLLGYYMQQMQIKTFTWRQLTPSITGNAFAKLVNFITKVDGLPFPGDGANFPDWFKNLFPPGDEKELNLSAGLLLTYMTGKYLQEPISKYYFCAQLVAATYMYLGLLDTTPLPPNGYAPSNFDDQPTPIKLNGAQLGPVTTVSWDGAVEAMTA